MIEYISIDSRYDDLKISTVIVAPEERPTAVLQIAHGMCGCKERYMPFMEFMSMNGIACIANDHRGHGGSVKSDNDLGYMYEGGKEALVDDMRLVTSYARRRFPDSPFYLLGHSMGSLAARSYVREDDSSLDGLVICGSPAYNPLSPLGRTLTSFLDEIELGHSRPKFLQKLISSRYNHNFRSEGPQSWTCSDPEVRRAFAETPKTNFCFTVNGSYNLLKLMQDAYSREGWSASRPGMPVIFLSGEDDPCMGGPSGLQKAVAAMRERGYNNVTIKTYPAMRHEILNEIGKEGVWQDIMDFISGYLR